MYKSLSSLTLQLLHCFTFPAKTCSIERFAISRYIQFISIQRRTIACTESAHRYFYLALNGLRAACFGSQRALKAL